MAKRVDYRITAQFEEAAEGDVEIKNYPNEDEDDEMATNLGKELESEGAAWVVVEKKVKGGKFKEIAYISGQ